MDVPVRLRFAPSPTGMFHVGGARTALWNWLYARQQGGELILRIEDTDEARNEDRWTEGIRSALRWLGLDWDAEVLQSDNVESHLAAAGRLQAAGRAYWCDCRGPDVEARRPEGAPPGYDGFCRGRGLRPGPGRALRFRVPPGRTVIADVVRKIVEFDNDKLGGDFVIVKGNGRPVFYLANTVDDLDEGITHVLRAEEHLPNAPKNQLLWAALAPPGVAPPTWAHLPVLVNEQRKKLSKRRDRVALESFREDGFLPEAMRNYLCLLGWSPPGDRELLTLAEMVAEFRLADVGSSPAFFDVKKLTSFNATYLRAMTPAAFAGVAEPFLADAPWKAQDYDPAVFAHLAPLVQERARTLAEVVTLVDFAFVAELDIAEPDWAKAMAGEAAAVLEDTLAALTTCAWDASTLHEATEGVAARHALKLSKAQMPVRVAVTGRLVGLPLFQSMEVLGRERTLARLTAALSRLGGAAAEPASTSVPAQSLLPGGA